MEREYHANLITQLKEDHQKILDSYRKTYTLFVENNSYQNIKEELTKLKALIHFHLSFEDSVLYPYLESRYKEDVLLFIKEADENMKLIAKEALKFIAKCSKEEEFKEHHTLFVEELQALGQKLAERIEFEEDSLYSLYDPN